MGEYLKSLSQRGIFLVFSSLTTSPSSLLYYHNKRDPFSYSSQNHNLQLPERPHQIHMYKCSVLSVVSTLKIYTYKIKFVEMLHIKGT